MNLQTALGGEGRAAHVAVERLLSYRIVHCKSTLFCIQNTVMPLVLAHLSSPIRVMLKKCYYRQFLLMHVSTPR